MEPTVPSLCAFTATCIFIDSSVHTVSPFATVSPSDTATDTTLPGIWLFRVTWAPPAPSAPAPPVFLYTISSKSACIPSDISTPSTIMDISRVVRDTYLALWYTSSSMNSMPVDVMRRTRSARSAPFIRTEYSPPPSGSPMPASIPPASTPSIENFIAASSSARCGDPRARRPLLRRRCRHCHRCPPCS